MDGLFLWVLFVLLFVQGKVIFGDFVLESGVWFENFEVVYQIWGKLVCEVIFVCYVFIGLVDVVDWWSGFVGLGCVFDFVFDFIVVSNVFGGCYGIIGFVLCFKDFVRFYGLDFFEIMMCDMVYVQVCWFEVIGVE